MNPPVGFTDPASVASEVYKYHRLHPELDDQAAKDQDLSGFLSNGVETLNSQTGTRWTGLSEEAKLQALKRVEQTPFFQRLRSDFLLYFYSNPAIWPLFGYEGPSNDQGGYLNRGFNDIEWIKREDL